MNALKSGLILYFVFEIVWIEMKSVFLRLPLLLFRLFIVVLAFFGM